MGGVSGLGSLGGMKGAGAGFAPTDLPDLYIWLDATQIYGVSDGGNVTTWPDLSGGGRDFTESTAPPDFETNEINGHPVVQFNGTDEELDAASLADLRGSTTIYMVVRIDGGHGIYDSYFSFGGAGADNVLVHAGPNIDDRGIAMTQPNENIGSDTTSNGTSPWILRCVSDAASPPEYIIAAAVAGGGASLTASLSAETGTSDRMSLAYSLTDLEAASDWLGISVGELIVYQAIHVTADQDKVQRYLGGKWGIT